MRPARPLDCVTTMNTSEAMRLALTGLLLLPACADPARPPASGGSSTSATDDETSGGSTGIPGGDDSSSTSGSAGDDSSTTDAPEDLEPWVAGDRLRPVVERDEDGQARLVRWFDIELEVECDFAETVDGFACTPAARWADAVFADADCSTPATYDSDCEAVPPLGTLYPTGCGPGTPMRRGAAVSATYFRDPDGACIERPEVAGYRLEPLAPSMLVAASRSRTEIDGLLGRWTYSGEDGSSQWAGPVELDTDFPCSIVEIDDTSICIASWLGTTDSTLHVDAACTQGDVAVAYPFPQCPQPRFIETGVGSLGTITDDFEQEALWRDDGFSCTSLAETVWGEPISFHAYRPFEPGDAPPVTLGREGSGRLQLQQPLASAGEPLGQPTPLWFDTELSTPCILRPDGTGSSRCAPEPTAIALYFGDADCSDPVFYAPTTATGWVSVLDYSPECGTLLFGASRIGGPYEGEVYRRDPEGVCVTAADPGLLFTSAQLVPPGSLAVLERAPI